MEVLNLRVQQETQKKTLFQADLNVQRQEVSNLYSSEKQLKQELNHLLELKLSLEKQNQELCRWVRFHDGWYIYITMILFLCYCLYSCGVNVPILIELEWIIKREFLL